jgi:hypothetical protein
VIVVLLISYVALLFLLVKLGVIKISPLLDINPF